MGRRNEECTEVLVEIHKKRTADEEDEERTRGGEI